MSLPPVEIPLGAMRFNSDSQKLEYFNGDTWFQVHTFSPDLDGGGRVVYGTGNNGSDTAYIDYITISTAGSAVTFGTATATSRPSGTASKTRGLINGGQVSPTMVNVIQYITISSIGSADDFGDLSSKRWYSSGVANQTRSVTAGGYTDSSANTDVIDYVTIASKGEANDFGDTITGAKREHNAGSTPTRGIWAGGQPGSGITNLIDFVTIASTGKVRDFGDLSMIMGSSATATSSTRMLIGGGLTPGAIDDIQSLTMTTLGNSVNFGNLTRSHGLLAIGASSDRIRGVFAGGSVTPIMDYVQIATHGDAVDFGDLTQQRYSMAAMSNCHGGLG